ncbi:PXA domain-containing protein [Suillus subalutaceus]|uniref:PXA domain-containing protein n=1 Tax=Suillus subalutaceus TaxID=48586 RepID=UPI001B877BB6|nr:PXA domain-containing protein [Suillus subalutaceus]KAG1835885.1 PXA domain-containing protein [Suillus subalutaceus]
MHSFISARSALAVAFLAVVFPVVTRAISSMIYLILLSPVIILFVALSFHRNALTHATKPLAFSTPTAWMETPQSLSPFDLDLPVVSSTLISIVILVVHDFVLTWYKDISPFLSFPTAVYLRLLQTAATVDLSALLVKQIFPKVTLRVALKRHLTQSKELDIFKPNPAVENLSSTFTEQNEEIHLRTIAERMLSHVLPEQEAHSKVLRVVVREILVCMVLYPIMDMVSDPDFWNRMIEQVAGAAIHQQKLISRVRNTLEAQSPHQHNRLPSTISTGDTITVRTDMRQLESFLRSINHCSSLLDACRPKNDIMGEIWRMRLLLGYDEKTEDVVTFLDRLYTSKRTVEQQIVILGSEDSPAASPESGLRTQVALHDILSNLASLSYFMEFMDRQHHSLLVRSLTLKEDISMIKDLEFLITPPHPALSSISKKHIDIIYSHAQIEISQGPLEDKKRQVQQAMEQDFEDLQRSELWFRIAKDFNQANAKLLEPPTGRILVHSMSSLMLLASRPLGIGSVHIFCSESSPSLSSVVQCIENPLTTRTEAGITTSARLHSTRAISVMKKI